MKYRLLVLVALAAVVSAACGFVIAQDRQASPYTEPVTVTITSTMDAYKAVPIAVSVGSTFAITVPSNITTGYSWTLATKLDEKIVKSQGSKYINPKQPEGVEPMAGAGGTEVWTFKAAGKGKTTINMVYVRPWEKSKPVLAQSFTITVQ